MKKIGFVPSITHFDIKPHIDLQDFKTVQHLFHNASYKSNHALQICAWKYFEKDIEYVHAVARKKRSKLLHNFYQHCFYTLLISTAFTHSWSTMLLHTFDQHCFYTLLINTAFTNSWSTLLLHTFGQYIFYKLCNNTAFTHFWSTLLIQTLDQRYSTLYNTAFTHFIILLLHTL